MYFCAGYMLKPHRAHVEAGKNQIGGDTLTKKKTLLYFMAIIITAYGFWNVAKGISQETTVDVVIILLMFAIIYLIWKDWKD